MNRYLVVAISLSFFIPSFSDRLCAGWTQDPNDSIELQREIAEIENGLGPSVQIKGKPPASWNIEDRMKHYRVPGVSVAVVKDGKLRWAKGYGIANTNTEERVTEKTLFQAGSISKPIAALAALKLVEQGKLDLDKDVNKYLQRWQVPENEFTRNEKVTLRRLLTHTAGLTVHGFPGYRQREELPSLRQVLDGEGNTASIRVDIVPGTQWRYSGGGYTVMQQLVEEVGGVPFEQFMADNILEPIGMKRSTFEQPLPDKLHAAASAAYDRSGTIIAGDWHNYPEQAAAGLWTTPTDLAAYCMEIQHTVAGKDNGILSQQTVTQMLTKHQRDWGLGPSLAGEGDELIFQHGGKNAGFTNNMQAYVNQGRAAIVMTSGDNGNSICVEILRSIADQYGWQGKTEEVNFRAMTPAQLSSFAGNYALERNGQTMKLQIEAADNSLKVRITSQETAKEIIPIGDTEFVDLSDGTRVTFTLDQNGMPTGLIVDNQMKFTKSVDQSSKKTLMHR